MELKIGQHAVFVIVVFVEQLLWVFVGLVLAPVEVL